MTYSKILCPTDFSEASYQAVRAASDLAKHNEAELCVLHVEAPGEVVKSSAGQVSSTEGEAARYAATVANLCQVIEEIVPENVRSRPLLKSGHAAEEIVRTARQEGADLIVMTAHGATGLHPGELGSVAEAVLRSAPCPVLTIGHAPDENTDSTPAMSDGHADISGVLRPNLEVVSKQAIYLDGD